MKLNHINLVVTDVPKAIHLFETYFQFTCTEIKGDNVIAILKGADGFTLVIMTGKEGNNYPEAFHIGFMLDTMEQVTALHAQLVNGGVEVTAEPRKIRDSFGFYFSFDGIMIEIGHYLA